MFEPDYKRVQRLEATLGLLKPFMDEIREQERRRCATIVRMYQPWDTPPKGKKDANRRAEMIAHLISIAAQIDPLDFTKCPEVR